jgi:hypothetical protein
MFSPAGTEAKSSTFGTHVGFGGAISLLQNFRRIRILLGRTSNGGSDEPSGLKDHLALPLTCRY